MDREVKLWSVWSTTSAISKTYPWFTVQPFEQAEIVSNWTTVVKIYYNRDTYTVTWKDYDWTVLETDENVRYEANPSYDWEIPTKQATAQYTYTFNGWDNELTPVRWDVTYIAMYSQSLNNYTVTWKDYDNTVLSWATYHYNDDLVILDNPSRAADSSYTYTFKEWNPAITWKVTASVEYVAVYNSTPKWWWGGGGWWGWSSGGWSSKSSTKTDTHWSADEEVLTWNVKTIDDDNQIDLVEDNQPEISEIDTWNSVTYSDEQIDAYTWAYKQWITTMPTIERAKLDSYITREQLAKMMVVFMSKVLGKKPVINKTVKYRDVSVKTRWQEFYDYIQLAYQYQIMWINAKWKPIRYFNPSWKVTRAEFATVLSRVLYWSKYNQSWSKYYEKHIKALENDGILTNIDPSIQELRWWIMLMLFRSTKRDWTTNDA